MRFEIEEYGISPISLFEAKQYCKVETDDDDTSLAILVSAIVNFAENMTHREVRNNKWFAYLDSFGECLEIRKTVVQAITKIEYTLDGNVLELDASNYYLRKGVISSWIELTDSGAWPTVDNATDAIRISFTTSPDMRLPIIKVQMLKHLLHAYENRGDESTDPIYGFESADFYKSVSIPNI